MLRGCLLARWDCNPPLWAQSAGQARPDASQETVEAASDAQRVRRIREVIEFDRARLEQARADQQERRLRLAQTSAPEKRASLERAIAKLNDELELLRAQSELAISRKT